MKRAPLQLMVLAASCGCSPSWTWCPSLRSFMPQAALEEIHKFSGTYTCMNTFKGRTWARQEGSDQDDRATPQRLSWCKEGNMDLFDKRTMPSGSVNTNTYRTRRATVQRKLCDTPQETSWFNCMSVRAHVMPFLLWKEAMSRSSPVVILGGFWDMFCFFVFSLFLRFLLFSFQCFQIQTCK